MAPCSLFANGQNRISEREDSLNSVKERGSHGALRSQPSPRGPITLAITDFIVFSFDFVIASLVL